LLVALNTLLFCLEKLYAKIVAWMPCLVYIDRRQINKKFGVDSVNIAT